MSVIWPLSGAKRTSASDCEQSRFMSTRRTPMMRFICSIWSGCFTMRSEPPSDILNNDHYARFGSIIESFARLEYLIQAAMAAVAGIDDDMKVIVMTKSTLSTAISSCTRPPLTHSGRLRPCLTRPTSTTPCEITSLMLFGIRAIGPKRLDRATLMSDKAKERSSDSTIKTSITRWTNWAMPPMNSDRS